MFSAAGGGEDARVPRVMPARPTPAQQQQLLRMPTLGSSSCRSSANFDEELSALANHAAYELSYAKSDSAKELEERQDEVASANVDIIKETDAKTADETDEAKSEDCTAYASAIVASAEDAGVWKQQLSEHYKNLDEEASALANHEAHELGNAKSKGAKQLDERQDDYAREVHLVACEVWARVPAEALVREVGEWIRKSVDELLKSVSDPAWGERDSHAFVGAVAIRVMRLQAERAVCQHLLENLPADSAKGESN